MKALPVRPVRTMTNARLILVALLALPAVAHAEDVVCASASADAVTVDGMLDEWAAASGFTRGDGSRDDAGFTIKCAYTADALYLAVDVLDERLIRSKKNSAVEDHLSLMFTQPGGGAPVRLDVWPDCAEYGAKLAAKWSDGRSNQPYAFASSLQPRGWSVEMGFPLGRLPGWSKGVPGIPFTLDFLDADLGSEQRIQATLSTGQTMLAFEEASALYREFLDTAHLKPIDVTLDSLVNIDPEPGAERVVAGGAMIGVITDSYTYVTLPVRSVADVREVKVVDLAGEGRSVILARYVERADRGAREVLILWYLTADGQFQRVFAHELGKQLGKAEITGRYELRPKTTGSGKKQKTVPGFDLAILAGDAKGFSADNYSEAPADDMTPVLLPWGDKKQEIWHFKGDEVFGPE